MKRKRNIFKTKKKYYKKCTHTSWHFVSNIGNDKDDTYILHLNANVRNKWETNNKKIKISRRIMRKGGIFIAAFYLLHNMQLTWHKVISLVIHSIEEENGTIKGRWRASLHHHRHHHRHHQFRHSFVIYVLFRSCKMKMKIA